jgi:MoxR-like ATPase
VHHNSGKTFLAEQVSRILKMRKFAFISCSAGMSESQVLGRLMPIEAGGAFAYVPTEFVDVYEKGGLFLFDEVDASDANMLIVLNTSLSNGHLALPSRPDKPVAKKHKDCIIIAAANTFGTGADRQYVGRNQLDEAFLDRFRMGQVVLDYSEELEAYLCPDRELRARVQQYRKMSQTLKIRRVISSRFLKDAYVAKVIGFDDAYIDNALFGGWKPEEILKVRNGK